MSSEKSSESFASLFEAEAQGNPAKKGRLPSLGQRCTATVVQIGRDAVFVEIEQAPGSFGKRQQAFLDLLDVKAPDGTLSLKPGDTLEAVVVAVDGRSGEVRLGRTLGKPQGVAELETALAGQLPVEGKVTGVNKGGLEIEIAGVRAFCPISQADKGYVADAQALVGKTLAFLVTEVREGGKRVVLSRRQLLEREAKERAHKAMAAVAVGATLKGTVTGVREFGAFVDLGGIEGLIPNQELSHERGTKASDVLTAGDSVEVQVREIKEGPLDKRGEKTTKITLSLKALSSDPWDSIATSAPVGRVLLGTVVRVLDFGAFVRIAPGVEGLLHVSELPGKVNHPSQALPVGLSLPVIVRAVDAAQRKISLVPAPEEMVVGSQAAQVSIGLGAIVQGTVDHVESFGVFLQIRGTKGRAGRGLIPNVELGTQRGADHRKLFPVGMELSAKVIETGDGKLKLSIRALKDDEERADFDGYRAESAAQSRLGTFADLLKKK